MAIPLINLKDNLKVILRKDDALVEDISDLEWENYYKNFDEANLRFIPGKNPTRFILKKQLNYGAQKMIDNEKIGLSMEGKAEIKMGHILDEVRYALIDIENPPELPEDQKLKFTKDTDGYANKDLIAMLAFGGYVSELYAARQAAINGATSSKK